MRQLFRQVIQKLHQQLLMVNNNSYCSSSSLHIWYWSYQGICHDTCSWYCCINVYSTCNHKSNHEAFLQLRYYRVKWYGRTIHTKKFNFLGIRKWCFIGSAVVILAGFIGMAGFKASGNRALNYSLEFVGGTTLLTHSSRNIRRNRLKMKLFL